MYSHVRYRGESKHIYFVIGQKFQLIIVFVLIAKHGWKCLRWVFRRRELSVRNLSCDCNHINRIVERYADKMLIIEMKSIDRLSTNELHL